MMTQRGLTASKPWMRADTHRGPEHNRSTSEAEYIDAALTFALSELHLAPHGRAIHSGTTRKERSLHLPTARRSKADSDKSAISMFMSSRPSMNGRGRLDRRYAR